MSAVELPCAVESPRAVESQRAVESPRSVEPGVDGAVVEGRAELSVPIAVAVSQEEASAARGGLAERGVLAESEVLAERASGVLAEDEVTERCVWRYSAGVPARGRRSSDPESCAGWTTLGCIPSIAGWKYGADAMFAFPPSLKSPSGCMNP